MMFRPPPLRGGPIGGPPRMLPPGPPPGRPPGMPPGPPPGLPPNMRAPPMRLPPGPPGECDVSQVKNVLVFASLSEIHDVCHNFDIITWCFCIAISLFYCKIVLHRTKVLSCAIRSILAGSHWFPQLCVLYSYKHRMHHCIQKLSVVSVTNKPEFPCI